jgi:hypothetical protein
VALVDHSTPHLVKVAHLVAQQASTAQHSEVQQYLVKAMSADMVKEVQQHLLALVVVVELVQLVELVRVQSVATVALAFN